MECYKSSIAVSRNQLIMVPAHLK